MHVYHMAVSAWTQSNVNILVWVFLMFALPYLIAITKSVIIIILTEQWNTFVSLKRQKRNQKINWCGPLLVSAGGDAVEATTSIAHPNLWINCGRLNCIVGNVGDRTKMKNMWHGKIRYFDYLIVIVSRNRCASHWIITSSSYIRNPIFELLLGRTNM